MTTTHALLVVSLTLAGILLILPRYLRVLRKGRWVSAEFYRVIAEWNAETQHQCAIEDGLVQAFPLDKGGRIRLARYRSQTRLSRRVVPAEIARDIEKLRVVLGFSRVCLGLSGRTRLRYSIPTGCRRFQSPLLWRVYCATM